VQRDVFQLRKHVAQKELERQHVGSMRKGSDEQQPPGFRLLRRGLKTIQIDSVRNRYRALHQAAVQFDELQQNFVAIASHELRTPATSVYGALATLRGRHDELSDELQSQLFEVAWHEADRMRRLIENLLDLSRVDSGRIQKATQQVDVLRLLEQAAGAHTEEVVLESEEGLVAFVDPLMLERVLSNLIRNARAYGRPPIRLSASTRESTLTIVVEDDGNGVPMELVPRLFDRFVRGSEGHGTGLGLAIARAYTRSHGGDLRYARGRRGARFEIVLPDAV